MNDQETLPSRRDVSGRKGALHRFPLANLAAALRVDLGVRGRHRPGDPPSGVPLLAELIGVSYSTVQRRLRDGLSERDADEWAIRCGLQPELVWPALMHPHDVVDVVAGAAAVNAAKTHCPRGHPYDRWWSGRRRCSRCHVAAVVASRRRLSSRVECSTQEETMPDRLLTIREVARRWQVSDRTVRRRIAEGTLRPTRIGGLVRFRLADIEEAEDAEVTAPTPTMGA
jgi:excisionase family DNA binding protein